MVDAPRDRTRDASGEICLLPDGSYCFRRDFAAKYERESGPNPLAIEQEQSGGVIRASSRDPVDKRLPAEKDKGRLQYSLYLQRLAGVTQVISPDFMTPKMHTRLSHTQKVSLVAGEIAKDLVRRYPATSNSPETKTLANLGGIDISVCEAAGLAHDIGHPPFGHVTEDLFDRFLKESAPREQRGEKLREFDGKPFDDSDHQPLRFDGFEGNAQSFRTVTRLDRKRLLKDGLDLTAATRSAILKYPWFRDPSIDDRKKKFGTYTEDLGAFGSARAWLGPTSTIEGVQTVEAAVMDLADDLAYALHDLQDFYLTGAIDTVKLTAIVDAQRAFLKTHDFKELLRKSVGGGEHHGDTNSLTVTRESIEEQFLKHYLKLRKYYDDYINPDSYLEALDHLDNFFHRLPRDAGAPSVLGGVIRAFADIMGDLCRGIRVGREEPWPKGPHIFLDTDQWHFVQVLKHACRVAVIETPGIGLIQQAQRAAARGCLIRLDGWLAGEFSYSELPEPLRSFLLDDPVAQASDEITVKLHRRRAIVDYLCTLTDAQVLTLSRTLRGVEIPRALDAI